VEDDLDRAGAGSGASRSWRSFTPFQTALLIRPPPTPLLKASVDSWATEPRLAIPA